MGCPHPDLLPLSSPQVTEWIAYYGLEPFGELRADQRAAMLAQLYATVHAKKGVRPKLKDYVLFPEPEPPRKPQKQSAQVLQARMLSSALKHKRKNGKGT